MLQLMYDKTSPDMPFKRSKTIYHMGRHGEKKINYSLKMQFVALQVQKWIRNRRSNYDNNAMSKNTY